MCQTTLRVETSRTPDRCVVRFTGEMDAATTGQLADLRLTDDVTTSVLLDITGVTFMDCAGLRSLLGAQSLLRASGRTATITEPLRQPARLMRLLAGHDVHHTATPTGG